MILVLQAHGRHLAAPPARPTRRSASTQPTSAGHRNVGPRRPPPRAQTRADLASMPIVLPVTPLRQPPPEMTSRGPPRDGRNGAIYSQKLAQTLVWARRKSNAL